MTKNYTPDNLEEALKIIEELKKAKEEVESELAKANKKIKDRDSVISLFIKTFNDVKESYTMPFDIGFTALHKCGLIPYVALSNLNSGALSIFISFVLSADFTGKVNVNRESLATLFGKNRVTISEYIDLLELNGFIRKINSRTYLVNLFYTSQSKKYNELKDNEIPKGSFFSLPPRVFKDKKGKSLDSYDYSRKVFDQLNVDK